MSETVLPTQQLGRSALGALIARVQDDIAEFGAAVIRGTNVATPKYMLDIATLLGTTDLRLDEELSGPTIMDLRYDPTKHVRESRPTYFTSDLFPLHTDMTYVDRPPELLLTQCVQPGPVGEGRALVADCRIAWNGVSSVSKTVLERPEFLFAYPPNCSEGYTTPLAVFDSRDGAPTWRFRRDGMTFATAADAAVEEFSAALVAASIAHEYAVGDLLVVDNSRVAHGRTDYAVRSDAPRHLRRMYARPHVR